MRRFLGCVNLVAFLVSGSLFLGICALACDAPPVQSGSVGHHCHDDQEEAAVPGEASIRSLKFCPILSAAGVAFSRYVMPEPGSALAAPVLPFTPVYSARLSHEKIAPDEMEPPPPAFPLYLARLRP